MGEWRYSSIILDLGITRRRAVQFHGSAVLYLNNPPRAYLKGGGYWMGPQNWFGRCGDKQYLTPGCPARSQLSNVDSLTVIKQIIKLS
jgi:hypothetical protein